MYTAIQQKNKNHKSPQGVMTYVLNCKVLESNFELRSCNYFHFQTATLGQRINLWGKRLKAMDKGQGCVAVWYLTPYFGYFILPPRCLVGVTPCPRNSQKNYTQESNNRLETKTSLIYLPLFTGFNNHSMGEGVFPQYIEMVESRS